MGVPGNLTRDTDKGKGARRDRSLACTVVSGRKSRRVPPRQKQPLKHKCCGRGARKHTRATRLHKEACRACRGALRHAQLPQRGWRSSCREIPEPACTRTPGFGTPDVSATRTGEHYAEVASRNIAVTPPHSQIGGISSRRSRFGRRCSGPLRKRTGKCSGHLSRRLASSTDSAISIALVEALQPMARWTRELGP